MQNDGSEPKTSFLGELVEAFKEGAGTTDAQLQKKRDVNKHAASFKQKHLSEGEEVIYWASAMRHGTIGEGIAVLTNSRFVFYRSGMLIETIEPWSLTKINSVEARKGLIQYDLRLFTGNDTIWIYSTNKKDMEVLSSLLNDEVNRINSEFDREFGVNDFDPLQKLKKLADLRDAGIVSEEEFSAKKAELLKRI